MMRKKVDKFYTLVIGKIVMAVGAVMVLAIAVQIATRYIPGFSITWTDELARLMFVWYGFLGAALAVPKGVHLGIDFFLPQVPGLAAQVLRRRGSGLYADFFRNRAVFGRYPAQGGVPAEFLRAGRSSHVFLWNGTGMRPADFDLLHRYADRRAAR